MNLTCVRIGFGKVAQVHDAMLRELGVRTIGVFEPDCARHQAIRERGFHVVQSIDEAAALSPDFFDVCAPTEHHADVLEQINKITPRANVIMEKPFCAFAEINRMEDILMRHRGRVVVNENYSSSEVVVSIKREIKSLGLKVTRVIVELSKHRGEDFLANRFQDLILGALGFEGAHLLAIANNLGHPVNFSDVRDVDIDSIYCDAHHVGDLNVNNLIHDPVTGNMSLSHQGGACIQYVSEAGCLVDLYSSMSGIIGFPCPPFAPTIERIAFNDSHVKYRHVRIDGIASDGKNYQVAGFLEPVTDLDRNMGAIAVFCEWTLSKPILFVADSTMKQHMQKILSFFLGDGQNPYSPEQAMNDVRQLNHWAQLGWMDMTDSNDVLGHPDKAQARAVEAQRFRLA